MKKKLSRIAALLLAVVMVITGFTVMPKVEAAEMPTFTVKVSSTEVKPGDKITVEFWLEGGVDVTSFAGFLNIDKNVYSYSGRDVEEGDLYWDLYDKGAMPIFSADESGDGFLVLLGDEVPMSEGGLIATITLTVKEDAVGTGNISFSFAGGTVGPDADHEEVIYENPDASKTVDNNGNVIPEGNIPVVIELEDLSIDQEDFTMARGTTDALTVTATPEAALTGKTIAWSSSDEDVVIVDEDGNIEAVGIGTATITASVDDFSDSVDITVNAPLTSITLDKQETTIKKGDTVDLKVIYNPEDTTDSKDVTWTSSDNTVASVDEDGTVTALKDGTTTITAKVGDLTADCIVNVREVPLEEIDLNQNAITLNKGEKSEPLVVSYNPDDTTDDKTVTWSSSDDDVATVENGVITATGAGTATITATVGEFTAECEVTVISPLESITLTADRTTDDLEVDDTVNLTVEYNPTDTTDDKAVTWSSSDEDVATVDENGVVTAVSGGTATITATSVVNENITATCDVRVLKHTTGITLDQSEMTLTKGEISVPLVVSFEPADTDDSKDVTWSTSDASVADVDTEGRVTAVGAGTVTITATVGEFTAECEVTVISPLESITLTADRTTDNLEVGDTVNLTVEYNPADTTDDKAVTWSSSDEDVATVDENGVVTAVSGGTATITAVSAADGEITATCDIRVIKHTTGITLDQSEMTLMKDEISAPLQVTFIPADTDDSKDVTWSSDNTEVAVVDAEGRVTGISEGTAMITATTADGGFTASCTVTVNEIHVEDAVLADDTPTELYVGQEHLLNVVITPENVTDEITYAYASSDETVATVDESGRISAVQAGNTEITVTVTAGEFTKELTFDLEVKEIPLEGIAFKEEITPLEEGQSAQLEILFNPENTTVDRTVTWLSSDESVATIEDGLVTAVKAGTTTISATVGDKEISYELTVTEKKEEPTPGTPDDEKPAPGGPATDDQQNQGTNKPVSGDSQNTCDKVNNQYEGGAVQTGDTTNIFGIILTMLISLSVAVLVVLRSRGKRILK